MAPLNRCACRIATLVVMLSTLASCGGGGNSLPLTYSIGGTVSGLEANEFVDLYNNNADRLTVQFNGSFTFATPLPAGRTYSVEANGSRNVRCTVSNGAGVVSAAVTNVTVSCLTSHPLAHSVGGLVSGLDGQGLALKLFDQSNCCSRGSTIEELYIANNGAFTFSRPLDPNAAGYGVDLYFEPTSPRQRCVVQNALFDISKSDVNNLRVLCNEHAYLTDAAGGSISAFSVDSNTGALASIGMPTMLGESLQAMVGTPDRHFIFVATAGKVQSFVVDPDTRTLTKISEVLAAASASQRSLALYDLPLKEKVSSASTSKNAYFLYVADAGSGNLSAYRTDSDSGVLTPLPKAPFVAGPGLSTIAIDLNGRLYAAHAGGSNDISAFQIDNRSGNLTPIVGSPFPSGGNVNSLAFGSPSLKFLYAAEAQGGTTAIEGYRIDAQGALTILPGFPVSLASCNYILTDQNGYYLYAAVGTHIDGYAINQATGALEPLAGFPVTIGVDIRSLNIDSTNQYLYAATGSSGMVSAFNLNDVTGALTPIAASPFTVSGSVDQVMTY